MIRQDIKATPGAGSCLFIGQDRCGQWVVKDAQSVIMLPEGREMDGAFTVLSKDGRCSDWRHRETHGP
jgi:hypothetical protein